jgi:hypothetical protein
MHTLLEIKNHAGLMSADQKKISTPGAKLVIAALGIALTLGMASCSSGDSSKSTKATGASTEVAAPAVKYDTLSAEVLYTIYDENEVKADEGAKGRTFVLTGTISNIGVALGEPYVVLQAKENSLLGVQCTFKDKAEVAKLSKGQQISLIGKCSGKVINVMMDDCHF